MHLRRDRNPYVTQALVRGSDALPPKQKRSAFDSRREHHRSRLVRPASSARYAAQVASQAPNKLTSMPRESAGVDIRLSSGGDGIETHTRRYGSERRSRNGFQIRLRRFESFQARRGGQSQKAAVPPCKQNDWERYPG